MRELEFDFPGLRVGTAEYEEGPTGCTVFVFEKGVQASADVRGGSVGTVMADEQGFLKALCLAGGSLLGLEAAAGVASAMFGDRGHEHVEWTDVPVVGGAIVFDFGRANGIYPDKDLGAKAYRSAVPGVFPLGRVGAGRNVSVGKGVPGLTSEPGGQGAASFQRGDLRILVFTVVNALGAIVDRSGRVVRGHLDKGSGERLHLHEALLRGSQSEARPNENTTLTLVLTNQRMSPRDLRQFGRQVHASMARAIQPFHTLFDGDVLWATTSNEVTDPEFADISALGAIASEVAWDAVLAAVAD